MPGKTLRHQVPHDLRPAYAQRAAKLAAAQYLKEYSQYVSGEWESDTVLRLTAAFGGKTYEGLMTVGPKIIGFSVENVPLSYAVMANMAFKAITKETQKWLDRAKNAQDQSDADKESK